MRRRWFPVIRIVVVSLIATVLPAVVVPGVASAAGPSVGLPQTRSVPVQQQTMGARGQDPASKNALKGNQPERAEQDGASNTAATSLAPAATWDVSAQTGDFTTSYPFRMPPAPSGFVPSLGLSYRSSAVDGRTSVTNNQPSWIGDGWDMAPGAVERTYGMCTEDTEGTTPPQTADLCWRNDNATASYGGSGGILIHDDSTGAWRPKNDNGARIERLPGADNTEYWKITTIDGTQYFFGSEPDSRSRWTVPVYGDDVNEPCHGATFDTSRCDQAWRWNLDKVIDRNGNLIRYFYEPETNSYGLRMKDSPVVSYIRGGTLVRAEYGMNVGVDAPPTARVMFTPADRCVPGSDCSQSNKGNWPDTPLDNLCTGTTCTKHVPTFFSTKRLAGVLTQVWDGSNWSDVDRWELDQQYPDPGSGEKAALWLKGIKHTGLANHGSIELPPTTFEGIQLPNRVATVDGISSLNRYRITGIITETGGITSVTYAPPECKDAGPKPDKPETNTMRCFPVRWSRPFENERTDYFHKYVVSQVVQSDRLSSSTEQVTSYEYLDGASWHWNMSEFVKDDKKTWDEFRGFGRVRVRVGTANDPAGPITMSEQRFYRGMNGDRLPTGTRPVSITDSEGGSHPDEDWLAGIAYETKTFANEAPSSQPEPSVLSKTITEPTWRGPTATHGALKAYLVQQQGTQRSFTALRAGGWRTTRSETKYDEFNLPVSVNDLGDESTAADDRCGTTTYARNDSNWLMNLPRTTETVAVACGVAPVFPRDAISAARISYDDRGNPTTTEIAKDRPASAPVYLTTATTRHDGYGRSTSVTDASGNTTRTDYVPATGGPLTSKVVTTPPTPTLPEGLVTTTNLETAFGQAVLVIDPNNQRLELTYDALGRRTQVWQPNRPRSRNPVPSVSMTYLYRNDAPTVVSVSAVGPNGIATTTNTLYDGMLRARQVQGSAAGGGRLLTDTRYDSHGRTYKSTQPYYNDGQVDDKIWIASDVDVPGLTRTEFDGAGRVVASVYQGGAIEKWRTTTAYGGDRVDVTPPAGGIPSTQISDARGQLTELRQYQAGSPTGTFDSTKYKYDRAGNIIEVTSPGGATWRYGYDLRGRKITSDDPDSGLTTMAYNDLDQLTSTRDARGAALFFGYDALARPTTVRRDSATGTVLTNKTYDTAANGKGQPATATRYLGADAYTTSVDAYSSMYQPIQTSVTIPPAEGLLARTYTTYASYGWDGSLVGETYPAAGDLGNETVSYRRDDFGRPLTSWGSYLGRNVDLVTATDYTKYGEPQRLQLGKLPKRVWLSAYYDDSTRKLTRSIVDAEVTAPMQSDAHYTYDPAGNVTSVADTVLGQTADTQCFRYDYLRRLTEAWTPNGGCGPDPSAGTLAGPAPYWQSYRYDGEGNRLSETTHASTGDTVRGYTYPNPGQPQPHTLRSVTTNGTNTDSYGYDAAGNTTNRTKSAVGQTLTWDIEGNLESVTKAGPTTSFVYGPDGGRLLRRDPDGTTLYLPGQEVRLAKSGGSPTTTRYYLNGDSQVVATRKGATLSWLAGDHQGTAGLAVDAGSMTVSRRRQLPFGGPRGEVIASWPSERGFVGGTTDPSIGLTRLGAREYDPATGRFLSVDPIQEISDPRQWNGYGYADNSPVTGSDPSGLMMYYPEGDGWPALPPSPPSPAPSSSSSSVTTTKAPAPPGNPGGGKPNSTASSTPSTKVSNDQASSYNQWLDIMTGPRMECFSFEALMCTALFFGGMAVGVLKGIAEDVHQCANFDLKACFRLVETAAVPEKKFPERAVEAGPAAVQTVKEATAAGKADTAATGTARLTGNRLATAQDDAVFWSGISGGQTQAWEWAEKNGGSTLEMTLSRRGVDLPAWDVNNPASIAAWKQASEDFARGAAGRVRVLQEDTVRIKSVWATTEYKALTENPNVTSIVWVDPRTNHELVIWVR